MRTLPRMIAACALAGCAMPPVQIRSAPTPTDAEVAQMRGIQTRVISAPFDSIFPKVVDVLLDNGYVVRSTDSKLGFVAFYQQWTDPEQYDAIIALEGDALFEPDGPASTRVRVALTGGSQRLEITGGGRHSTDTGMVGKAEQSAAIDEYRKLLDALESGLASARR
jgi:hypothetical protein